MKTILIRNLSISNFKGIKSLELNFNQFTQIFGRNETGKSTIVDAVLWVLFGKNAKGESQFDIKNTVNTELNRAGHIVKIELLINDSVTVLKKVYKEVWKTKRGEMSPEFSGHTTEYFWNDVPLSAGDYQKKISEIINENLFKLITSPSYFVSLAWEKQREMLIELIGGIDDYNIASMNPEFEFLANEINEGKSIKELKAQTQASIKKLKENLESFPIRIDEVLKNKPENLDFDGLENQKAKLQSELEQIQLKQDDEAKANQAQLEKIKSIQLEINNIEIAISKAESLALSEAQKRTEPDQTSLTALKNKKENLEQQKKRFQDNFNDKYKLLQSLTEDLNKKQNERAELLENWHKENDKNISLDQIKTDCPTCKRPFETHTIEEQKKHLITNFNTEKTKKLTEIEQKGLSVKNRILELEKQVSDLKPEVQKVSEEVENVALQIKNVNDSIDLEAQKLNEPSNVDYTSLVQTSLSFNDEYQSNLLLLQAKKDELKELEQNQSVNPNSEQIALQKKTINDSIFEINQKLVLKSEIARANERIEQLKKEERVCAETKLEQEKILFLIEEFNKEKMQILDSKVNGLFEFVKFKLYETQINGGEKETCEAIVEGVPYRATNTASQINAGIDIINAFTTNYQVTAPIFIDNAESVNEFIKTSSQLVCLRVTETDYTLRVE